MPLKTSSITFYNNIRDRKKINQMLANPNIKEIINQADKEIQTVLFHAGLSQDEEFGLEMVQLLLKHGADPMHKEENQETIVYYLAGNNKAKILEKMITEFGYNLNQNDTNRQTPIFFAASNGRLKCAQILIKNGANVNHLDVNSQTCLFYAAKLGHLQMCKQLVNRGCDPLIIDKFKRTASYYAKVAHHHHIFDYLSLFKKEKKASKMASVNSDSQSVVSKKVAKKKELPRHQYVLSFMDNDGNTKHLSSQQIAEMFEKNPQIKDLINNQEQLQNVDTSTQANFHKRATKLLNSLLKRQDTLAFHSPVPYEQMGLLDYPNIIHEPMDFTTMKTRLAHNCYTKQAQFSKDINLCYENCIKYNGPESIYGRLALKLQQQYNTVLIKEFYQ